MPMEKRRGTKVVAVSGGFDPLHKGHVRLCNEAKALGDYLVVILNNDHWLLAKKGFVFMDEAERMEILQALRAVDEVVLTRHAVSPEDMSVCGMLRELRPHIFANGGDRKEGNVPEYAVCTELDIEMAFGVGGGKVQSSSQLVQRSRHGPHPRNGSAVPPAAD